MLGGLRWQFVHRPVYNELLAGRESNEKLKQNSKALPSLSGEGNVETTIFWD